MRVRLALPLLAVAAVAASVTLAFAAPSTAPEPALPNADETVTAGSDITFLLKRDAPGRDGAGYVFFEVAAKKERDRDGTLRSGTLRADSGASTALRSFQREMKWDGRASKRRFTFTLRAKDYAALRSYWAKRPGTYYWIPFVVNCEAAKEAGKPRGSCILPGKVNSFTIVQ